MSGNGFIPYQSQTFDYLAIFFGFLLTLVSLVAWQWWPNRREYPPEDRDGSGNAGCDSTPIGRHLRQRQHSGG